MLVLSCYIATDGVRYWSCHLTMLHCLDIANFILFCTFIVSRVLPHWATGDDTFRAMFTNISKLRSVVINIHVTLLTSQNGKMWTSWTIPYFRLQWFWNDVFLMQKEALVISTCRCFCLTKSTWPMPHSTSCEGKAMHSFALSIVMMLQFFWTSRVCWDHKSSLM